MTKFPCCVFVSSLALQLAAVNGNLGDGTLGVGNSNNGVILQRSWKLYHSFDGGDSFEPRATIRLQVDPDLAMTTTTTTTTTTTAATTTKENSSDETIQLNLETPDNEVPVLDAEKVESMLRNGLYQLKLVEEGGVSPTNAILATVDACQVRRANFRDELTLVFGWNGKVLSLSYVPQVSPLAPKECGGEYFSQSTVPPAFETKLAWETAKVGMSLQSELPKYQPPPGLNFLKQQPVPGIDDVGPDGKPVPPPEDTSMYGYLRKYWYLWIPLLLNMLLRTEEPLPSQQQGGQQEGQQQEQQGGQQAQVRGAAPAGAASGAKKQRRGKKG